MRETRRGLTEYLRIYTGSKPEISKYIPGMRLDYETKLGVDNRLSDSATGHHFTVILEHSNTSYIDINTIKAIIEAQKPAHTVYTLQIRRNGQRKRDNGT